MTVKELIEKLKKFDENTHVSVEKDGADYVIGDIKKDVLGDISIKI
jgi:hypothetical protein